MSEHPIELEIRAVIDPKSIPALGKTLLSLGFKSVSKTRRTMVMFFGTVSASGLNWDEGKKDEVDIRCRVTNGKAEVVTKVGRTSAANRIETSVPVSLVDMLKFAQSYATMPLMSKVGSRQTENFKKGTITVSIVSAVPSKLSYIELERMTTRKKEGADLKVLQALAKTLDLNLIKTHEEYLELCDQLSKGDDWVFRGTVTDIKRLKADIKKTGSDKK